MRRNRSTHDAQRTTRFARSFILVANATKVAEVAALAVTLGSETTLLSSGATSETRALLSETGSVAVGVSLGEARVRAVALLVVVSLHVAEVVAAGEASRTLVVSGRSLLEASLKAASTLAIASSSAIAYGSNATDSRANADGDTAAIPAAGDWANSASIAASIAASVAVSVAASVASSDKTTATLDLLVLLASVCGDILLCVFSEGKAGYRSQHSQAQRLHLGAVHESSATGDVYVC